MLIGLPLKYVVKIINIRKQYTLVHTLKGDHLSTVVSLSSIKKSQNLKPKVLISMSWT